VGLGGVIGVSVFVIDLPISVGVEYGLSAFWKLGDRTKWKWKKLMVIPTSTRPCPTIRSLLSRQLQYSSIKQRYMTMDTNDQVRLVVNIFFN
jgi:hypothetical protein